jgi:DNA-binding XRE family transcriptional regulator
MDVTRQTIYRWEHGERIPDVLTFIRLTRLLGVDISDIIEFSED